MSYLVAISKHNRLVCVLLICSLAINTHLFWRCNHRLMRNVKLVLEEKKSIVKNDLCKNLTGTNAFLSWKQWTELNKHNCFLNQYSTEWDCSCCPRFGDYIPKLRTEKGWVCYFLISPPSTEREDRRGRTNRRAQGFCTYP